MATQYEQMSLFCPCEEAEAICCMDGGRTTASAPEGWMKRLVPTGEYVVMVGAHPLVLRPVPLRVEDIQEGHHYYHYLIGGQVFAGIFVGQECAS
mgnify:FL=1